MTMDLCKEWVWLWGASLVLARSLVGLSVPLILDALNLSSAHASLTMSRGAQEGKSGSLNVSEACRVPTFANPTPMSVPAWGLGPLP